MCPENFNPRSPHGERPDQEQPSGGNSDISIHAPRTGSDSVRKRPPSNVGYFNPRSPHGERRRVTPVMLIVQNFNPRSPHGERLGRWRAAIQQSGISIHAPRTGSDSPARPLRLRLTGNFNPRSPHGERQRKVTILSIRIIGFAQKVYHKTVLLRISLAENAVILPEKPRNPVRTSLQKAGGLRFARAIRAARPYSISSPSGA